MSIRNSRWKRLRKKVWAQSKLGNKRITFLKFVNNNRVECVNQRIHILD